MKNLKGYIREIKIVDDTCVMRKPDLFCKRSGQMKEVAVEINDMCQELVDYLEYNCRPIEENGHDPDCIISLSELNNTLDEEFTIKDERLYAVFRSQLLRLVYACEAIVMLGNLDPATTYLAFSIS